MANVNFQKSPSGTILANYRYGGGQLLRYSIRKKVHSDYWIPEDERKDRSYIKKSCPDLANIQQAMISVETAIRNIESKYMRTGEDLTLEVFKEELNRQLGRTPESKVTKKAQNTNPDLIEALRQYYGYENSIEKDERAKQRGISEGTLRHYKVLLNKMEEFAKYKNVKRIEFRHINGDFYDEFISWLRGNELSKAYCGAVISKLKAFLNYLWDNNPDIMHCDRPGWKVRKFKRLHEKSDNIYLNTDQLKRIEDKDLSKTPQYEKARDLFLLGCWTGLRFSDYNQIKPENFGVILSPEGKPIETIKVTPQKTGQSVVIPLHPCVKRIVERYEGKTPEVPKHNQVFNRVLKKALKACGLTERISIIKPIKGERVTVKSPLWEEVASHVARRSFASNMFKSGLRAETIMRITGHATESSFARYLCLSDEEHALIMAASPLFTPQMKVVK